MGFTDEADDEEQSFGLGRKSEREKTSLNDASGRRESGERTRLRTEGMEGGTSGGLNSLWSITNTESWAQGEGGEILVT